MQGRRRRSQAERSAGTRQRLLDAAIACLRELGYVETTTIAVAARAGLSRGAMLHHFGTRTELLRAVGDEVLVQSEVVLDRAVERAGGRRESFEHAFDGLFDQLASPLFPVAAELMVAFRTDPEMKDHFAQLYQIALDRTNAHLKSWAFEVGVEDGPALDDFLDLVAVTVSGVYFQAAIAGGMERIRTAIDQLQARARALMPPPGRRPGPG